MCKHNGQSRSLDAAPASFHNLCRGSLNTNTHNDALKSIHIAALQPSLPWSMQKHIVGKFSGSFSNSEPGLMWNRLQPLSETTCKAQSVHVNHFFRFESILLCWRRGGVPLRSSQPAAPTQPPPPTMWPNLPPPMLQMQCSRIPPPTVDLIRNMEKCCWWSWFPVGAS